ncbi:methyltransferase domain-containing protein [Aetokthonos hydrillicola]|uniref:methyltransferase domain-containing protein n=1 Tax=Aetokthonos hydrillicola TaxID=1550245 RepID=UPI001FBA550B|nr:methyltransferase domain-containing protein [Aetokthonos hydrillicola]
MLKSLVASLPTPIKLLDIGGTVDFWETAGFLNSNSTNIELTLINLSLAHMGSVNPTIKQVVGDAKNMKMFQDKEFDVVFSNSVIEHVGDYHNQQKMANEVMRVGKKYFIQTPNIFFPIEPHFVFPFFQFLPLWLRVSLVSHFDLGWKQKATNKQQARDIVTEIRLLSKREFMNLFPGSNLYEEKFLGLTKSFVVYGGWEKLISE